MAAPQVSDELAAEAVEVRSRHNSLAAAARELKILPSTLANRLKRAAERGLDGSVPKAIPAGRVIKGVSTMYGLDKDTGDWVEKLMWVKDKGEADLQHVMDTIKGVFETYKGKAPLIAPPKTSDADLLSVYPVADQHIGLMAWGQETGEDYDLSIAADRLRSCAARLIAQSPNSKQAVILNLGDFQHNDDGKNMTPGHGNPLDVDGRYMKVLTTGVQLMMDLVEMALQKHETVLVRNLPGNHDPHAALALTVALGAFYSSNPRVVVDDDPSEFFFHRFGEVLIGANHGHRMKPADMAMVMAVRRREDWGKTKFKHFMFGHIHHITAKEVAGVLVESFQTLAAKDAWSHAKGFTSGQSISSITFHREDGEIGRHRVNV